MNQLWRLILSKKQLRGLLSLNKKNQERIVLKQVQIVDLLKEKQHQQSLKWLFRMEQNLRTRQKKEPIKMLARLKIKQSQEHHLEKLQTFLIYKLVSLAQLHLKDLLSDMIALLKVNNHQCKSTNLNLRWKTLTKLATEELVFLQQHRKQQLILKYSKKPLQRRKQPRKEVNLTYPVFQIDQKLLNKNLLKNEYIYDNFVTD